MLKELTGIIERLATVRVLVILALLAMLFPLVLFPAAVIGDELPLDLYWSYSPAQAYDYLDRLVVNGRIAYARMELSSDLLFPVVYSLALTVALLMAARGVLPAGRRHTLYVFPIGIVVADWCENLSLAVVIHAFPDRLDALVTAASLFTSLKWTFIILALVTLFVASAFAVSKHLLDRQGG